MYIVPNSSLVTHKKIAKCQSQNNVLITKQAMASNFLLLLLNQYYKLLC